MDLIKIMPDSERVKSILKMVLLIEERIKYLYKDKFYPLILSDYYEIIKELITAILLCDGFKTLSHKDLIDYLKLNYKNVNNYEIDTIDKLRILRNRITYEGFEIESSHLKNNETIYIKIIKKLKSLINNKLKT
ncbi:MAG: hypothetical protein AABW81_00845 [Nanoarchaeota archaeon]